MIYQIAAIKNQLPKTNKGLIQAKNIQHRLNNIIEASHVNDGTFWSPITVGPYLVPVTRWTE